MSAPRKYTTEEERRKAYKEQQNNYSRSEEHTSELQSPILISRMPSSA